MSTKQIVFGILAGVAAGATLGVLFAPDKGSSTRKKIVQKRDEYVDELGEKINGLIDGFSKKFETIKRQAARMSESGAAKLDELEAEVTAATNSKMR